MRTDAGDQREDRQAGEADMGEEGQEGAVGMERGGHSAWRGGHVKVHMLEVSMEEHGER